MKSTLYTSEGKKKSSLDLPKLFDIQIRSDLVDKYLQATKFLLTQAYSPDPKAGRKHSASGTISHKRHDWKGHYGRGISRIPRKTMWRRGTQFYWVGAEVSSARGGRRVHGPKLIKRLRKINKKEIQLAMNSALASTASQDFVASRYSSLEKAPEIPMVIESLPQKTKSLVLALKSIFPNLDSLIFKNKTVRAGKGKLRGRKYKSSAGLLIITAPEEKTKLSGFDIQSTDSLTIQDLYPLGRLTLYTQKAIDSLEQKPKEEKKE
tara:strand:- start:15215 stop:16006 length:792 start_codon:yes stop_codon:yes gene_type:complete